MQTTKHDDALRAVEETKKLIMNSALDAIICMDTQGFITIWTPQAEKTFGWKEEEVIGKTVAETIIPPQFREQHKKGMQRYLQTGEGPMLNKIIEITALDKNGREFPVELTIAPIKQGDTNFFCAFIRDITERVMAREALKESEERYRSVIEQASDAIMITDEKGDFLEVNSSFCKRFGYTKEELTRMNVKAVIDPLQLKADPIRFDLLGSGQHIFRERKMMHRDGRVIEVEANIKMLPDGRILAIARDITERKKAEKEIKESHENYESLVNTIDGIVWEADAQTFEFNFVSHQAERLLGYPVERWVNEPGFWKEHIHEEDRTWAVDFCIQQTRLKKAHEFEYRMIASDGKPIWLRDLVTVLVEDDKPVKLRGIMVDITERKKAEDEILKMHDRLRHISQATNDAIWDHDLQTGEIWWNDKLYELYGIDTKEKPGGFEAWTERLHPDDRERVIAKLMITQKEKSSIWQDEYRFRLPDGSYANMFDRNFYTYKNGKLIRKSGSNLDITPLKKAEETLINNELRFRTLTSNAPVGIFQTDTIGNTIYVNETWIGITGMRYEDALGFGWLDAVHPEDRVQLLRGWNEKSVKGQSSATDYRFIDAKGNIRWVSGNAVPLYNKNGEFAGHIGTLSDITERKNAEAAVRESEEKYRTLVEQAGDAIAIFDLKGRILDVNHGATILLGFSKKEMQDMTLIDILTPEELAAKPVRYDLLESGEGTIRQRKMRRKDGSLVETEVHAKRLTNGNFLALIRDLSERIKVQQQIEREKRLADSIIESLPGVFYLFDDQCRYIRWNKFKETISGYTGAEISKMSPLDFFEEPEKEMIRQKIGEGFVKGETIAEAHLVTKTGKKIPYYFTGIALEYEGKSCLLGTGIDISDRKNAENILRESSEQLRHLSAHLQNIREEERIDIAREIHDELGQQLTVLKMDISWLKKKIVSKDEKVEQKMNDLMEVIDNTVKTVRKISSDLRPSMLDDLGLVAALEWHCQEFEKRSGIKTKFDAGKLAESGPQGSVGGRLELPVESTTAMYRIFQESLTNVARHAEATKVDASLKVTKGQLQMQISDNGKGFSVNGIQNKKTLGILGMRERVYIMNGEYTIESIPGKGTTVKVTIPVENNHKPS